MSGDQAFKNDDSEKYWNCLLDLSDLGFKYLAYQ